MAATTKRVRVSVLKTRVLKWMRDNGMMTADVRWYTISEWKERGEPHGNESSGVMTIEGSPMYRALNHGEPSWKKMEQFTEFLKGLGYYYELLYAWAVGFYPL